ncbi:Dimeric alpha+beta barrel [Glarea lozoyensis ATCC 20868]|uniref:Dimeric alpha+beta barrel n=1 Tax=Glarea lozoyensis (strain ATCC 20868 / MF5171) TaxID=1116229 RepID=S3CQ30_GLAL2|nr:Dimeric alpha+beta barrel [Glarea lozoyensis ATCC 20868]EPE27785.1 Dimeric alpha+beta barrel [Glarea lozoyensis ATCC 20868]
MAYNFITSANTARKPSVSHPNARGNRGPVLSLVLAGLALVLFLQWSVYGTARDHVERVGGMGGSSGVVSTVGVVNGVEGIGSEIDEQEMALLGGIVHVVMFEFVVGVEEELVRHTCDRFIGLKDKALTRWKREPYIKRIVGGRDNSIEDLQRGITHIFIVEFENEADRKYYVESDPAHKAFKKDLKDIVKTSQVIDFVPGFFGLLKANEKGGTPESS